MKIIPTWLRASLPMFYQTVLQDFSGHERISSISCTEHFIKFNFGNSVDVFAFDKTHELFDYFQVARMFFVSAFFY